MSFKVVYPAVHPNFMSYPWIILQALSTLQHPSHVGIPMCGVLVTIEIDVPPSPAGVDFPFLTAPDAVKPSDS
jgi:hypothetical protein